MALALGCCLSAVPLLGADPLRILVVGDSISVGYTDNPKWTVPFEFGFRSGLCTRLTSSGIPVQFVGSSPEPWNGGSKGNYGVPTNKPMLDLRPLGQDHCEGYGGKRTDFILAHMPAWLTNHSPDVILLMIGINDIKAGSTNEPVTTEQNLSNIVSTVVSRAPNTRLIVAQITPRSTFNLSIAKYNEHIRDVLVPHFARQGKHVTTVDQYTNMLIPGTATVDATLFSNGINHPNAAVYDRMAETWFNGTKALSLSSAPPATQKH
jgi:lysophospholipase L1-like esterase